MRRVLVLGGYGTFGSRIVRLLARKDRWQIVVAGRSLARAEALVREIGGTALSAMALDRDRLSAADLQAMAPWLVIDASGPFQGAQAPAHPVVRAALAAGAHYIDIADAPDFVTGIVRFDAEAKASDLVVVSGASSVPALSSAVVADLAREMDAVLEIETAISSSNQATLGRSVHAALLSYAGKPIRTLRFGTWRNVTALQDWKRVDIAVPGRSPVAGRLVAPCEVPDNVLLPARYPGLRKAVFRAGTELGVLNRMAGLLARLVSWRVMASLAPLTGMAARAFGLFHRFGSARSGMIIDARGRRGGVPVGRRWSVVAEQGDGLWIPAMAAALLTENIDRGRVAAGAKPGVGLLTLAEFRAAFAPFEIRDAITEREVPASPLRRWLRAVDALPTAIRRIHDDPFERSAAGSVTVTRGTHPLARLMSRLLGFPPSGTDLPILVEFEPKGDQEIWRRCFGASTFTSRLEPWPGRPGHVRECVGPLAYGFEFVDEGGALRMAFRRWWCCGLPLPRALGPRVDARQWQEGDDYCFSVDVGAPGIGRVIAYRGRLRLNEGASRPLIEAGSA